MTLGFVTRLSASWWDWQFGASFGHRRFVDVYPVLALGIASAFTSASRAAAPDGRSVA